MRKERINENSTDFIAAFGCLRGFYRLQYGNQRKWGLSKSAPNEYMVAPRAPLSLPPEYDLLPVGVENYYQNDAEDEDLAEADQNLLAKISKSGTAGAAAN